MAISIAKAFLMKTFPNLHEDYANIVICGVLFAILLVSVSFARRALRSRVVKKKKRKTRSNNPEQQKSVAKGKRGRLGSLHEKLNQDLSVSKPNHSSLQSSRAASPDSEKSSSSSDEEPPVLKQTVKSSNKQKKQLSIRKSTRQPHSDAGTTAVPTETDNEGWQLVVRRRQPKSRNLPTPATGVPS